MNVDELARLLLRQIGRTLPGRQISPDLKQSAGSNVGRPTSAPAPGPPAVAPPPAAAWLSLTKAFDTMQLAPWWDETGAPKDRLPVAPPLHQPMTADREQKDRDIVLGTRAGQGGQLVTIQLAPPGLGPLTAVLSFSAEDVRVRFAVEDESSMGRIEEMTPLLRRSLGELWDVKDILVVQRPAQAGDGMARPIPSKERPPFDQQM